MNGFSEIELQMIVDELKKGMPLQLELVGHTSKLIVAYYQEYKKNPNVEPADVVSLAVKSGMNQMGLN
ncbi:hypothetical protein MOC52_11180 [Bacillus inaquosorum]|uniref:hypothetical protein n=1 Tax=Bacillus inaquosorum TaxID=483913 RepID=UPI002280887E|nr:hypothetical protein [Bacillus inaquosorum]MCY8163168.1 hypothetical protein [Bacillus inaquosorum]MCY8321116.1 hypothetical protein [Bacillus inaquosorum]MCY8336609.1 hypothetical protein [Bacillus inaquosorum]